MVLILEGLALCLWLLFICITGKANGNERLVVFYEPEVQDRAVELGLTTKEKIRNTSMLVSVLLFLPLMTVVPFLVYKYNGAETFLEAFIQMTVIYLVMGLFDRLFIDAFWVQRTKDWIIPGTEDLMPYIHRKTLILKWAGTLIGFPLLAAVIAWIYTMI